MDRSLLTTPGGNKQLLNLAIASGGNGAGSQTGATLITAVSGKCIYVYYVKIVADAATTFKLLSNATALTGAESYPTQGGFIDSMVPPSYIHKTAVGEALKVTTGAGAVNGFIKYWVE